MDGELHSTCRSFGAVTHNGSASMKEQERPEAVVETVPEDPSRPDGATEMYWRCRAAGPLADRWGASVSDAAGALDHRVCSRRLRRHHCTADGAMALRATRSVGRCRKSAWRRHQYRH